jgi:surface antigen
LRARLGLALGGALCLAACGLVPEDWRPPPAGFLGRQFDPGPPPVTVTNTGGLYGEVIAGSDQSPVPAELVDAVIGGELRRWLSPADRAALAEASQHAAVAERNTKVAWQARPPNSAAGVAGWASPVSDPYRATHGALCREVRQALARADDVIVQTVSLCREEIALGGSVWTLAHWP